MSSRHMRLSQALAMGMGGAQFVVGLVVVLLLIMVSPPQISPGQSLRLIALSLLFTAAPLMLAFLALAARKPRTGQIWLLLLVATIALTWTGFLYG